MTPLQVTSPIVGFNANSPAAFAAHLIEPINQSGHEVQPSYGNSLLYSHLSPHRHSQHRIPQKGPRHSRSSFHSDRAHWARTWKAFVHRQGPSRWGVSRPQRLPRTSKFALPRTRRWRQVVSGQTQEGYTDDARGYEMIDYFCTGRYFRSAWMWVSENTEKEGWDGRSAMVPPVVSIPISGCVAMVSLWT